VKASTKLLIPTISLVVLALLSATGAFWGSLIGVVLYIISGPTVGCVGA